LKKGNKKLHIKRVAQIGVFTALSVSLGYVLFFIPNVELISSSIFASGWLFGPYVGITVGGLSFAIFALFNPLGASLPPLFLAQIIGGMLIGVAGGYLRTLFSNHSFFLQVPFFALTGAILTLIYDLLTNIGAFIAFTTEKTFYAYVVTGILFSVLHIFSNIVIFSILLLPTLRKIVTFTKPRSPER